MDDKAELVRLAFRVHALCDELDELDRLLNDVVGPAVHRAGAEARSIQARLRELAGVRRIDFEAATQAADNATEETRGRITPEENQGAGSAFS